MKQNIVGGKNQHDAVNIALKGKSYEPAFLVLSGTSNSVTLGMILTFNLCFLGEEWTIITALPTFRKVDLESSA